MNADEAFYDEISPSKKEDFQIQENKCYTKVVSAKVVREDGKNHLSKVVLSLLMLVVLALLLGVVGACVALGLEIAKLKSETASLDSRQQVGQNEMEVALDMLYQQLIQNYSAIEARFDSFYKQTSQNISATEDLFSQQLDEDRSEFHNLIHQLNVSTQLIVNHFESMLAASCAALPPSSPSGYYWVRTSNGSAVRVYCDMTMSCGGVTGGWVRVAKLDMTDSSHRCPSGLRQRTDSNIRTCVKSDDQAGCSSPVNFISNYDIHYSMICGRILAYQYASTNAFEDIDNIDSNYVDGVSLTLGDPRQHIWTFAAGRDETSDGARGCPCLDGDLSTGNPLPSYVGNDYFCDTGSTARYIIRFYSEDRLWDGAGCGSRSTCCSFNNPPWFYKQLSHPTADGIEMRVCRNQLAANEDVAIEVVDIYIQ